MKYLILAFILLIGVSQAITREEFVEEIHIDTSAECEKRANINSGLQNLARSLT
jgi:hypothetical protein